MQAQLKIGGALARPGCEPGVLDSEIDFYETRAWCLNAFPRLDTIIERLKEEIAAFGRVEPDWRRDEVVRNIFLLACAVSDTIDDFVGASRYDFSRAASVFAPSRVAVKPVNAICRGMAGLREHVSRRLWRWRDEWEAALRPFLRHLAYGAAGQEMPNPFVPLLGLLQRRLPARLLSVRPRIPAAFRSQDVSHPDVFALGRKFVDAYPDRTRPILVAGLRTAGSYLAPLLCGLLEASGYTDVAVVTLRPKIGLGRRERLILRGMARRDALAVLIDEPVYSASTFAAATGRLKECGFAASKMVALFPTHPNRRDWRDASGGLALSDIRIVTIAPEEWHKCELLTPESVTERLSEYLGGGHRSVRVRPNRELDAKIEAGREPGLHWRLKRVFDVEIRNGDGSVECRTVLAKSVGWGWLGYHAFLAGTRLSDFVPPVLGLRDGILYMEWLGDARSGAFHRADVETAASYVAARAKLLRLSDDPSRDLALAGRHRGSDELAGILSGAYGWKISAVLKRPRIRRQLTELACNCPTLIDGKLRAREWLDGDTLLKADFEHHAMGKHELNITDPAYDLAEIILHWKLSLEDERRLLDRYSGESGDRTIASRLFLYKLLAGVWAMNRATENLKDYSIMRRHQEFNRQFLDASTFLTVHAARFCAGLSRRPEVRAWSKPIVMLDVDGVLDRQIFGFPSTTSAGIQAVSLLASHGIAVALNTARSVTEMKEYCRAYGFIGGVAEYGAYVWDALSERERTLVHPESIAQIERLKDALRPLPGVFLNDDCRFIVKAFTYACGTTVPLPEALIRQVMARLNLDRLRLHQTFTDSTAVAADVDKGVGLRGFLALTQHPGWPTIAIGDSEPDLPMFREAGQSFAPGQTGCGAAARQLGCRVAGAPYQAGLLEIVRSIVHPDGKSCENCSLPLPALSASEGLFFQLLEVSDRSEGERFLRSVFDPSAIGAFQQ